MPSSVHKSFSGIDLKIKEEKENRQFYGRKWCFLCKALDLWWLDNKYGLLLKFQWSLTVKGKDSKEIKQYMTFFTETKRKERTDICYFCLISSALFNVKLFWVELKPKGNCSLFQLSCQSGRLQSHMSFFYFKTSKIESNLQNTAFIFSFNLIDITNSLITSRLVANSNIKKYFNKNYDTFCKRQLWFIF